MRSVLEIPEVDAAAAAILAETDEWRRIMALDAKKQLDVYLDIKSPHAYLAVRPTLEVARDYRVRVNFLRLHTMKSQLLMSRQSPILG